MKPLNFFQYWNTRFKSKSSIILFYALISVILAAIMYVISFSIYFIIQFPTLVTSYLALIIAIIASILIIYLAWPIFFKDYFIYRKYFKN